MTDHVRTARVAFDAMRNSLVDRGLLGRDHRLTPAGHAWVDALIAERQRVPG